MITAIGRMCFEARSNSQMQGNLLSTLVHCLDFFEGCDSIREFAEHASSYEQERLRKIKAEKRNRKAKGKGKVTKPLKAEMDGAGDVAMMMSLLVPYRCSSIGTFFDEFEGVQSALDDYSTSKASSAARVSSRDGCWRDERPD